MAIARKSNNVMGGYHTSRSPQTTPKNALVSPTVNMIYDRNGHPRNFNGFSQELGGGTMTYQLDNGWASLGSAETPVGSPAAADIGSGNIIEYYNKSLIFVGTGVVKANFPSVHNATRTIGIASSTPKIAVLNGTDWDDPVDLGLAPVSVSPEVEASGSLTSGFAGLMKGVRAFKTAVRRESTGGLSDSSPASNVVDFQNSSALITMPPARTDGSNIWRLYSTPAGFANVGFFQQLPYEIKESELAAGTVNYITDTVKIKSTGVSRQIEVEFNDQDLLSLQAPENMFAASAASFVSALGNVLLLIGTFKGVGLSPSIPNMPEAFPPDLASFISEPVVGVSRPASGFLYILCQNSIWLAMMGGAVMGGTPVMSRPLVTNIGVKNQKSAVTVGDGLYIFSSGGKPIRISPEGEMDNKFADRVKEAFAGWDPAKTVVTYDEESARVMYCYGKKIMSYDLEYDRWNSPVDLSKTTGIDTANVTIVSGFTRDGVSNVVWWNETDKTYTIGKFDKGTLGSSWILRESWDDWGDYRVTKDMFQVSGIFRLEDLTAGTTKNILGEVFRQYSETPAEVFMISLSDESKVLTKVKPIRCYHIESGAVQLSCTGYGHTVLSLDSDADVHRISK